MKKNIVVYIVLAVLCVVFFVALFVRGHNEISPSLTEKHAQNTSDTISALLFCHASDYFVYHGAPIGFQYDMLKQMAKDLGKKIFITVESDPESVFYTCFLNEYDLVAMDINKNKSFTSYLTYSEPHSFSYPVLIANKKTKISDSTVNIVYVSAQFPVDLAMNEVKPNTKWKIVHTEHVSTEDLFEKLNEKEVDFIASDYNLAVTLLPFYPDLHIVGQIGGNFGRTWVLNSYNTALNDTINQWIQQFKQTAKYKALCRRYLAVNSPVIQHSFGKKGKNRISSYDETIKRYCKSYAIDWRFVSSIIFQETKFNTDIEGFGGSFGIMQIMPSTADYYGITAESSVEEQLKVGVKHIASLYNRYKKVSNIDERYYVTAAAYNAGSGHVQDAIALSSKYEKDSVYTWQNISKYLALKSHKDYYNDPAVRCGYYPGKHAISYANQVMDRYHAYKLSKN